MNSLFYYLYLVRTSIFKGLSFRKITNVLRGVFGWKMGIVQLRSRPFVLRIEPSAICNLACVYCKTPTRQLSPDFTRLLPFETFEKAFDFMADVALRCTLYMEGEPMVNPHLFQMVKKASGQGAFTSFSTNFNLIKPTTAENLVNSGLNFISICLDGYTQESYSKYRVRGNVSTVMEGITSLIAAKKAQQSKTPFVNVYSILFDHVLPEVPAIEKFCNNARVDRLTFRPDESGQMGRYSAETSRQPYSRCFWPWITLQVDSDGSVYPCPVAFSQHATRVSYGNINNDPLKDIWNNEKFRITRAFLSGRGDAPKDWKLQCTNCRWHKSPRALACGTLTV